jgi:hypothetical protein
MFLGEKRHQSFPDRIKTCVLKYSLFKNAIRKHRTLNVNRSTLSGRNLFFPTVHE